jgi:beta,beta-carotene 9',10'-dioxygenase
MDDVPLRPSLCSLDREHETQVLQVRGRFPTWLRGTLIRNGPGKFASPGHDVRHLFDGLALLQRFGFGDGEVTYCARFLRGNTYRSAMEHGRAWSRQFGTSFPRTLIDVARTLVAPRFPDNAGVNVVRIAGHYLALTESPRPIEFDPRTLRTKPDFAYDDELWGESTTAHPHHDPARGELVNMVTKFSGRHREYRFYRIGDGGIRREQLCALPVDQPGYLHSFGLSPRYLVLAEFPLVLDPLRLLFGESSYIGAFRWRPGLGTRFRVVERDGGKVAARFESDPCFAFHHLNAYESGGELVVDLVAYDDASIIDSFYFDRLARGDVRHPWSRLLRYRIDIASGRCAREALSDGAMEFCSINPALAFRSYRFVYAVGSRDESAGGSYDRLVKMDVAGGSTREWREADSSCGEPLFIPTPGASSEDDGVVLALVHVHHGARDFLLALSARDWSEMARAYLPGHVPYGFHGRFFPAE